MNTADTAEKIFRRSKADAHQQKKTTAAAAYVAVCAVKVHGCCDARRLAPETTIPENTLTAASKSPSGGSNLVHAFRAPFADHNCRTNRPRGQNLILIFFDNFFSRACEPIKGAPCAE